MDIDTQSDGATPIARTRRYERERGFTRGAFVVVPDWEPQSRYYVPDWYADALAHASVAENMLASITLQA